MWDDRINNHVTDTCIHIYLNEKSIYNSRFSKIIKSYAHRMLLIYVFTFHSRSPNIYNDIFSKYPTIGNIPLYIFPL